MVRWIFGQRMIVLSYFEEGKLKMRVQNFRWVSLLMLSAVLSAPVWADNIKVRVGNDRGTT